MPKATNDPLSDEKESLMQKAKEGVTSFHTWRAIFTEKIEGIILKNLLREVINAVIMVFTITIDNKKSLDFFFLIYPIET